MHIVITGGAGFLGVRLARALIEKNSFSLAGAPAGAITRLALVDSPSRRPTCGSTPASTPLSAT